MKFSTTSDHYNNNRTTITTNDRIVSVNVQVTVQVQVPLQDSCIDNSNLQQQEYCCCCCDDNDNDRKDYNSRYYHFNNEDISDESHFQDMSYLSSDQCLEHCITSTGSNCHFPFVRCKNTYCQSLYNFVQDENCIKTTVPYSITIQQLSIKQQQEQYAKQQQQQSSLLSSSVLLQNKYQNYSNQQHQEDMRFPTLQSKSSIVTTTMSYNVFPLHNLPILISNTQFNASTSMSTIQCNNNNNNSTDSITTSTNEQYSTQHKPSIPGIQPNTKLNNTTTTTTTTTSSFTMTMTQSIQIQLQSQSQSPASSGKDSFTTNTSTKDENKFVLVVSLFQNDAVGSVVSNDNNNDNSNQERQQQQQEQQHQQQLPIAVRLLPIAIKPSAYDDDDGNDDVSTSNSSNPTNRTIHRLDKQVLFTIVQQQQDVSSTVRKHIGNRACTSACCSNKNRLYTKNISNSSSSSICSKGIVRNSTSPFMTDKDKEQSLIFIQEEHITNAMLANDYLNNEQSHSQYDLPVYKMSTTAVLVADIGDIHHETLASNDNVGTWILVGIVLCIVRLLWYSWQQQQRRTPPPQTQQTIYRHGTHHHQQQLQVPYPLIHTTNNQIFDDILLEHARWQQHQQYNHHYFQELHQPLYLLNSSSNSSVHNTYNLHHQPSILDDDNSVHDPTTSATTGRYESSNNSSTHHHYNNNENRIDEKLSIVFNQKQQQHDVPLCQYNDNAPFTIGGKTDDIQYQYQYQYQQQSQMQHQYQANHSDIFQTYCNEIDDQTSNKNDPTVSDQNRYDTDTYQEDDDDDDDDDYSDYQNSEVQDGDDSDSKDNPNTTTMPTMNYIIDVDYDNKSDCIDDLDDQIALPPPTTKRCTIFFTASVQQSINHNHIGYNNNSQNKANDKVDPFSRAILLCHDQFLQEQMQKHQLLQEIAVATNMELKDECALPSAHYNGNANASTVHMPIEEHAISNNKSTNDSHNSMATKDFETCEEVITTGSLLQILTSNTTQTVTSDHVDTLQNEIKERDNTAESNVPDGDGNQDYTATCTCTKESKEELINIINVHVPIQDEMSSIDNADTGTHLAREKTTTDTIANDVNVTNDNHLCLQSTNDNNVDQDQHSRIEFKSGDTNIKDFSSTFIRNETTYIGRETSIVECGEDHMTNTCKSDDTPSMDNNSLDKSSHASVNHNIEANNDSDVKDCLDLDVQRCAPTDDWNVVAQWPTGSNHNSARKNIGPTRACPINDSKFIPASDYKKNRISSAIDEILSYVSTLPPDSHTTSDDDTHEDSSSNNNSNNNNNRNFVTPNENDTRLNTTVLATDRFIASNAVVTFDDAFRESTELTPYCKGQEKHIDKTSVTDRLNLVGCEVITKSKNTKQQSLSQKSVPKIHKEPVRIAETDDDPDYLRIVTSLFDKKNAIPDVVLSYSLLAAANTIETPVWQYSKSSSDCLNDSADSENRHTRPPIHTTSTTKSKERVSKRLRPSTGKSMPTGTSKGFAGNTLAVNTEMADMSIDGYQIHCRLNDFDRITHASSKQAKRRQTFGNSDVTFKKRKT